MTSVQLLKSTRPNHLLLIFIAVGLFAVLMTPATPLQILCMQTMAVSLVASQFMWNDLCDAELDVFKNKILLQMMDHRLPYSIILTLCGIALGVSCGVATAFVLTWAALMLVLTWYSRLFKRYHAFGANIICAACTSVGIASPLVTTQQWSIFLSITLPLIVMITAREAAMDIEEHEADKNFRRHSLPQLLGKKKALKAVWWILGGLFLPASYAIPYWLNQPQIIASFTVGHVLATVVGLPHLYLLTQKHDWYTTQVIFLERHIKLAWLGYLAGFLIV